MLQKDDLEDPWVPLPLPYVEPLRGNGQRTVPGDGEKSLFHKMLLCMALAIHNLHQVYQRGCRLGTQQCYHTCVIWDSIRLRQKHLRA